MNSLREQVIDEAIELVKAMTKLCLEYQSLLRDPRFAAIPDGGNYGKRLELADECNAKFRTRPWRVARRLQVAGYQRAADLLVNYATIVGRFSLLTVSWDAEGDIVLLEDDVTSESDRLLGVLEDARKGHNSDDGRLNVHSSDEELSRLLAAGDLIGELAECSDDYFFYFEGLQDAHEDEDEIPNDVRLKRVTKAFDQLPVQSVLSECNAIGRDKLASAIEELSAAVSAVVHLPSNAYPSLESGSLSSLNSGEVPVDGVEINVEEVSLGVKVLYDAAIYALLQRRCN